MKTGITERLASVDAFRGIVMARIVTIPMNSAIQSLPEGRLKEILNTQFHHSVWHGITWLDFTFAGFIMLMGLSVRFSLKKYKLDQSLTSEFYSKVTQRTILLFLLGFLYNGGFSRPWPDIRLCGILQRMAICYFFASIIYLYTGVKGRCWCIVVLLLGYWGIIAMVPFPGGEAGTLEFNKNLVGWIDSQLIPGRMYFNTWDPEGILSTMPAFGSALIGVLWGDLLLSEKQKSEKLIWLVLGGLVAINLSVIWDIVFPINKYLWTSSYVLVTAGIGSILLGGCFLIAEIFERKNILFPFIVVGRNLLVAFIMMRFIPLDQLALTLTGGDVSKLVGNTAPFVTAFTETVLMWLFLLFLYRKNIVVRI